ncbi:MAG TPA: hypothetical protein VMB34_16060 [Acetobacteraceae bacterium]|nr:hypothetical protein [Acetobacteraceae bacterium]
MTDRTEHVLRTFPPRPLNPDERALVQAWLAIACDVASAYVSERRSDDPAIYHRIVVTVGPEPTPSFLIHAPAGLSCWLVQSVGGEPSVRRFDSLRAALNAIRPVFPVAGGAREP